MRYIYKMALILLPVFMLSLTGCGSSSDGSTGDPFSNNNIIANGGGTVPIFGNISTATGKTGITLTTDRTSVDVNNGQILVTAKIVSNGVAISGVPVTFSIVAPVNGPATIETGLTTVPTDSNGTAISRITTGNTLSTTNVIVSATATIGTQFATANTAFQIVRGTGVITVGVLPVANATVDPSVEATRVFQQQIPIRLTDSNGNPRVGAPVTLSVYTQSGTSLVAFNQQEVTTDASGTAIFNASVTMTSPSSGLTAVDSVIYKVATIDANPIVAYAAAHYSITSSVPTPSEPIKTLSYNLTLSTVGASGGGTTVGPGSTVVATAVLIDINGNPVANQDVQFEKVDSLAPVTIADPTIKTDSNGKAINFLKADNLPATSSSSFDVIIKASAIVNGQSVTSLTIFKIVRSAGNVINFITSKSPTDPDGTLNKLAVTLTNVDPVNQPSTGIVQLVPFEVVDSNGIPMPRQPVAVSIYSVMGGAGCTASIDSPEPPAVRTVTTDDNGKGIFNAVVSMATPPIGSENSCSIIYRATTTLAGVPDPPVFSYGGFIANVKNELP